MMEETALIYSQTCRTKEAVSIMKMALEWGTEYADATACWKDRTEMLYEYVKSHRRERILEVTGL